MHKIKKKRPVGRKNAEIFCIAILLPVMIHFVAFHIALNFNSVLLAFKYYDGKEQKFYEFSKIFTNFVRFFNEVFIHPDTSHYLLNGVWFQLLEICTIPVGYIIAFIIYKKLPFASFYMVVMFIPGILSGMITSLGFKAFVNDALRNAWEFILKRPRHEFVPPLFSDNAFIILCGYKFFNSMCGALLVNVGTMRKTPEELVDYGKLEGLTMFQEFIYLAIPMMFALIQIQCLTIFSGFFNEAGPLFAVYGTGQKVPDSTITFGYYMQASILGSDITGVSAEYMYGYTSAVNLTIGLLSVPVIWGTKKLFDLFDPEVEY